MIAKLFLSPNSEIRLKNIEGILESAGLKLSHPDVLYIDQDKLGVIQARKIVEHFNLKPYSAKGRGVAVLHANNFTPEAQNILLKILEEPPNEAVILLSADSDKNFLPTILSRCQVERLEDQKSVSNFDFFPDIEKLIKSNHAERFAYIENLEDKDSFFDSLINYYHEQLKKNQTELEFLKTLLEAQKWKRSNVNIRAILEYLMFCMPGN